MSVEVSLTIERNAAGRFDYVVTTTSGYRAVIEKCARDECADGHIAECRRKLDHRHQHETGGKNSVNAWLSHSARHCHGWHDGRIADLMADIERTYGSHKLLTPARACRRVSLAGRPSVLAKMLGWTVEDVEAELALAGAAC